MKLKLFTLAVGYKRGRICSVRNYSLWLNSKTNDLELHEGSKLIGHFPDDGEVYWFLEKQSHREAVFITSPIPSWLETSLNFRDGMEFVNLDALLEEVERVYVGRIDGNTKRLKAA